MCVRVADIIFGCCVIFGLGVGTFMMRHHKGVQARGWSGFYSDYYKRSVRHGRPEVVRTLHVDRTGSGRDFRSLDVCFDNAVPSRSVRAPSSARSAYIRLSFAFSAPSSRRRRSSGTSPRLLGLPVEVGGNVQ